MKKLFVSALALSTVVSLPILAADDKADKNPMQLTDLNKPLQVQADQDEVTLRLPANRTTGFSWYLVGVDREVLSPEKMSYEAPNAKNGLVGAPGVSVWTFKVNDDNMTVPTVSTIKMAYMRPWESTKSTAVKSIRVVFSKK